MSVSWFETTSNGYEVMAYKIWEDIGINIRKAREAKGLTAAQLAKAVNCPESRILRYEYAETKSNLKILEALSKELDVTVEWLINARIDSKVGNCLYKINTVGGDRDDERHFADRYSFHIYASSARMAFLKTNEIVRYAGRRYLQPGQHACVKLIGVPVTADELRHRFTGRADDDEPVDKSVRDKDPK